MRAEPPPADSQVKWNDDRPKEDPKDDRLGYANFARLISDSILTYQLDNGLVIGIYGKWGSGKSTVLNFMKANLAESAKPPWTHGEIIRMDFNPWLFSDSHRSLVQHFLNELLKTLVPYKAIKTKLKNSLAKFLEAKLNSDELTLVGEAIREFRPNLGKRALQAVIKELSKHESLSELKMVIQQELRATNTRIVVFIDDIDRLERAEIKQIFQLVKAVADFPRITYVLALDPQMVEESLEQKDYLDKIIQCPFELPAPNRQKLDIMFEQRLFSVAGVSESRIDKERWYFIYSEGIRNILTSPRRVHRFANALMISLRAVVSEVDICDFLGLELLRIFYPTVYSTIRGNKQFFTGLATKEFFGPELLRRMRPISFIKVGSMHVAIQGSFNRWLNACFRT